MLNALLNNIFNCYFHDSFYFVSTHFSSREDTKERIQKIIVRTIFKLLFDASLQGRNMLLDCVNKVVC
jgi:hypothetical protein